MDVKLPKLGEGADSGVVVNIFVKEGDTIAKDQAILELENEKAVASIPSTAAGVVTKIYIKNGDRISFGQRVLSVADAAGAVAAPAAAPKALVKKPVVNAAPATTSAPEPEVEEPAEIEVEEAGADSLPLPAASPSIRKMARELGINLRKVRGSESGGRIVLGDVRAYIQRLIKLSAKPAAAAVTEVKPAPVAYDFAQFGPILKKPVTNLRGVIARRMTESWTTIPHVTQFDDADFNQLNELRKKYAAAYQAKGVKLTMTPLVLKAIASTLKVNPIFNSSLDEVANEIIIKEYIHLGIAVDTELGLIVPVIRDVDKKSIFDIAKELEQIASKARERKLSGDELKGGTFTISNQGAIGGSHFTPIINKPEVAILGLGRGALKPVVREGKVEIRLMTPLGLSYDHRVIDGGAAARFTVDLVKAFENFAEDVVKI